jgi:hypothetical protein
MKKFKILALVLLCGQMLFAQSSQQSMRNLFEAPPVYQFPTLRIPNLQNVDIALDFLRDDKSADIVRPDMYEGVDGSPFISEKWLYARIKLEDNRIFDSVSLKLNLFENKVYFKDGDNRPRQVGLRVAQIEIRDASSEWNNTIFLSGFGTNQNAFYQVLGDGKKIGYLKELVVIQKEYKMLHAATQKKFEFYDGKLFLYAQGILYDVNKDCSTFMPAFGNDTKVSSYMSSNGLKCHKEKDLKKLVDYYNSY